MKRVHVRLVATAGLLLGAVVLEHVLVRAAAHAEIAHALLAGGSTTPPTFPAICAIAVVLVRLFVVVLGPGIGLAAAAFAVASLIAWKRTRSLGQ